MSLKPREVLLSLHRVPGGGPNLATVLRVAIGMASSYNYHHVRVVLFGEGVLCALRQVNPPWIERYLASTRAHNIPLYADRESLTARGFTEEDVTESVKLISSQDFLDEWRKTDMHIRV